MVRNSASTHGPVTSSRSISTRGLIRRATATHSAFIRLMKRQRGLPVDHAVARRSLSIPVERESPEIVIEQMGDDVTDGPERAGGRPVPIGRTESTKQAMSSACSGPKRSNTRRFHRTGAVEVATGGMSPCRPRTKAALTPLSARLIFRGLSRVSHSKFSRY